MLFFGFHQQNVEFAALPTASWLSASNVNALPHTFLVELNYQDQPIGHVWCCNRCDIKGAAEFFSVQATSSAADHLRKHVPVPFNIVHKIPSS
jgi:hypothetical protein